MTDLRQYSKPARKRIERTLAAAATTTETVVQLVGSWNCVDLWVTCPIGVTSPWPRATFTLWGKNGGALVPLQSQGILDVPGNVIGSGADLSRSQLVLSIRSRQCDTFLVTLTPGQLGDLTDEVAELELECWASDQPVIPSPHDRIELAMSLPTTVGVTAQTSFSVAAGPAILWRASAVNNSGAVAYLGVYDDPNPLVGGETPIDQAAIAAGMSGVIRPPRGERLRTGLQLGISSVAGRFVPVVSGDFVADWDSLV